jgi:hypothetical protein
MVINAINKKSRVPSYRILTVGTCYLDAQGSGDLAYSVARFASSGSTPDALSINPEKVEFIPPAIHSARHLQAMLGN